MIGSLLEGDQDGVAATCDATRTLPPASPDGGWTENGCGVGDRKATKKHPHGNGVAASYRVRATPRRQQTGASRRATGLPRRMNGSQRKTHGMTPAWRNQNPSPARLVEKLRRRQQRETQQSASDPSGGLSGVSVTPVG